MNYKITKFLIESLVSVVVLNGCSSSSPSTITQTSADSSKGSSVQVTKDIVYAIPAEANIPDFLLDIYKPNKGGASPVVVFLHGSDAVKEAHESESQALAEGGALVFTINWPTPNSDLAWKDDGRDFRLMSDAHICAIRFARAHSPEYSGDPTKITVVGFSMGARIGSTAALAGDALPVLWDEFAVKRGGPPSQIECVESETSANVEAFVGIGGRYNSVDYLKRVDPELWEIVSPYAHIGHSPDQRIRLILGERDQFVNPETQAEFNQLLLDAGYDSGLTLWNGTHTVPIELTTDIVMNVAGK